MRALTSFPRMIPRSALAFLVAGTFIVLSAACSTIGLGGGSSSDRGAQLEVRVNNDHAGAERVTVSMLDGEGNRKALGEVRGGERRSFDTTGDPGSNARHRLMAESSRDETILSPEIVVRESSIITWNLRDNRVEVYEAREKTGG